MKRNLKEKKSKIHTKKSFAARSELPDLVAVMMKVAERLEILERKMDQVMGRVSSLPSEMRQIVHNGQRSESSHQPQPVHSPQQNQGRTLYQAVCADCHKSCEVPFKPGVDRPVYCKACFVIRKAGHVPQDPDKRSQGPIHPRPVSTIPRGVEIAAPAASGKAAKSKKSKPKKSSKKHKKK